MNPPCHSDGSPVGLRGTLGLRIVFAALGLTTLYLLWLLNPGVSPSQRTAFHWSSTPASLWGAIALDMVFVWGLITLLLAFGRISGRVRVAIWAGMLFFLPWGVLPYAIFSVSSHHWNRILFLTAFVLTSFVTALWGPAYTQFFERLIDFCSSVLMFVGLFGLLLLAKLAWNGLQAYEHIHTVSSLHAKAITTIQPHRIIWIIMDELSYQQVYEDRFPGLKLPSFDAFAAQSTVFTRVVPMGIDTEVVLPGLIQGKTLTGIRTLPSGQLLVYNATLGIWSNFDPHDTVFQDALNKGYATAVAGWYNPYCRIMSEVFSQCFWTYSVSAVNNMSSSGTVVSNAIAPFAYVAIKITSVGPAALQTNILSLLHVSSNGDVGNDSHINDYLALTAASDKLVRDRSAGFILLHLPIPHPGGIFDRKTGKFSVSNSSYIDNLALADICLGNIRAALEQTGQWESSTVVVMGDHSWRTKQLWWTPKIADTWTQTDEMASHDGKYDERPVYIVKLPGQTTADTINSSFGAVNTRSLFDHLLTSQIVSISDLKSWAQATEIPPVTKETVDGSARH